MPAATTVALRPGTPVSKRLKALLGACTTAVAAAELVLAYVNFLAGLVIHAALVFSALTLYSIAAGRSRTGPSEGLDPALSALPAVAFVPLIRVLSAAVAVKGLPSVFLTGIAAVPVAIGAFMAARAFRAGGGVLRLRASSLPAQALIGLSGAGVGAAAFFAIHTDPISEFDRQAPLAAIIAITAVTGVAEEVVFRGLIQGALERVAGAGSVAWSAFLFAALYIGSQPLLLLPLMAAAGLYFGWCARRTGSIVGVCIAHAVTKVILVLAPVVL